MVMEVSDGKGVNVAQKSIFNKSAANINVLSTDSQALRVGPDLKCSGSFCKSPIIQYS